MQSIIVKYNIDKEKAIFKRYTFYNYKKTIRILKLNLFLGIGLFLMLVRFNKPQSSIFIIGAIIAFCTFALFTFLAFKFLKVMKTSLKGYDEQSISENHEINYNFNNEGCSITSLKSNTEIKWVDISKFEINNIDIYFHVKEKINDLVLIHFISEDIVGVKFFNAFKKMLEEKVSK